MKRQYIDFKFILYLVLIVLICTVSIVYLVWFFTDREITLSERVLAHDISPYLSTNEESNKAPDTTMGIGRVGFIDGSSVSINNTVLTSNKTLETNTENMVQRLNNVQPKTDSNNSTSTLLLSGETFTGSATDVSNYPAIALNVKASQNGTLYTDFSADGINWNIVTVIAYTANTNYTLRKPIAAQYYRVRFNNAGADQTEFRLQTILGSYSIDPPAASIDTTGLAVSGVKSSANSSTTPLAGGATFTGSSEDIKAYSIIIVNVATDQNGSLCVDFSSDAVNWDIMQCYDIDGGQSERFSVNNRASYCRIRFTNTTGTLQSYLRLQTIFSVGNTDDGLISKLNSTYTPLLADETFTGTWENVSKYAVVTVNGRTDQIARMWVQFSANASTIFSDIPVSSGTDSSLGIHTFAVATKYYRVKVVNGSTNMGLLEVQSTFSNNAKIALATSRVTTPLSDYSSVLNTRCVGFGQQPSGTYSLTKQNGQAFSTTTVLQGTLLNGVIDNAVTTVTVDSTTGFSSTGTISIDDEEITYTGVTPTTFTGCTRGSNNTTAASHADDAKVGEVYSSSILNLDGYNQVQTHILSSHIGKLVIRWYNDAGGSDLLRTLNVSYDTVNDFKLYSAPAFTPYVQYKFYNQGGVVQTDFFYSTDFLIQALSPQISNLDAFIAPNMVAQLTRSILSGLKPNNRYSNVNLDSYGHLETAIHGPLLPFGSIHTENLTPVFQFDGVYGINDVMLISTTGNGGTASTNNSSLICSTDATLGSNSTIQSKKRIRYRPGQGSVIRFTAKHATAYAQSYQVFGMGHPEDGYYMAYRGTEFGILYIHRRLREIVTLTLQTAATSSGNVTINFKGLTGGSAYPATVPVTNSNNIYRTAWEIASFNYVGWKAVAIGATVVFLAGGSGARSVGSYTFTDTDTTNASITSFVTTRAGTSYVGDAATETFIPQTAFNFDVLDGSNSTQNPSGIQLDTSKFNLFEIDMQYLGAGPVEFKIMTQQTGNNPTWTTFHSINNPNNITLTHVGNPSFPFTMSAYSTGSTTPMTIECGSVMAGVEGKVIRHGPLITYSHSRTGINSNLNIIFLIRNSLVYNNVPNQSVITLRSISAAAKGANNTDFTIVSLIKNPTITGNVQWVQYDATRSCALYSNTSGLTATPLNNAQLLYSTSISESGQTFFSFDSQTEEFDIQPGDYIAVCANSSANTTSVTISVNTREDQ